MFFSDVGSRRQYGYIQFCFIVSAEAEKNKNICVNKNAYLWKLNVSDETVKKRWDNLRDSFVLSRIFSKNECHWSIIHKFHRNTQNRLYTLLSIKISIYIVVSVLGLLWIKNCLHVSVSVLVTVPGLLWTSLYPSPAMNAPACWRVRDTCTRVHCAGDRCSKRLK